MTSVLILVFVTGFYPLGRAWRANRRTPLLPAINVALVAWAAWVLSLLAEGWWPARAVEGLHYVSLCFSGCAGVAVLGARRPGVGAWNFVLAGLLAVLLLPLGEGLLAGKQLHLETARLLFLAAVLAVPVLNYLPTRLGPAAGLLAASCTLDMFLLAEGASGRMPPARVGQAFLAMVPWLAWAGLAWRAPVPALFDRLWFDFRDRFGLVWGQRLREQFNNAAAHAGWPVVLRWQGLRLQKGAPLPEPEVQEALVEVLRKLLKRFGPADSQSPEPP